MALNKHHSPLLATTGFVQVMENLESHEMEELHFPGLDSHEI